jgi:two-component system, OmpR family, KDP operon response regulator KdpE
MTTRILVVDDDPQMQRAVTNALRARHYSVATAATGEDALELVAQDQVDLVLLDLGLPGIGGHDVIVRLRSWTDVPVIVVTVRDAQEEKVAALEAGADDYVTKPFGTGELLARMGAVLRRSFSDPEPPVMQFDNLEIDLARRFVRLNGEPLHLTPTEYRLLETMAKNPGKLMTHRLLLQQVWGPGYGTESNYLRLYVRQLRQKLADDPSRPKWITTEPGLGYRWLRDAE